MANEKQLISVNALVKDLEFLAKHEDSFRQSVILGVVQTVKAQPTVDAVEVVRCRYYKYYVKFESSLIGEVMCCTGQGSVNIQKQPDDFCSYGERKDCGGNG